MAGLTWLHLSDWHQWGKEFDRHVVLDKFLEDIRNRKNIHPDLEKIDLIIFSGDVAFSGKKEEYQAAVDTLFNPLLEATGLDTDRLFIIPGNHDFDRDEIELLPVGIKQPFESSKQADTWMTDEKRHTHLLAPFNAYKNFVSNYTRQDQPDYASILRVKGLNRDIALLGLNSALMCNRHMNGKEVDDRGFLVVGEPQIHDRLKEISDAELRIVVVHHPFDWLTEFDRDRIEGRLKKECHFILCGHLHKSKVTLEQGTAGACSIISAGALYDGRIPHNPRYTNAYNFVHLDFEDAQATVYLRRWSEAKTEWIVDIESDPKPIPTGYYSFALPKAKQLTETTTPSTRSSALPRGWEGWSPLRKENLDNIRATGEITDEQVVRYFDGMIPNWKCALTSQIPRRAKVGELVRELSKLKGKDQPHVVVLRGGGGEGKSTILRQAVCDLLEKEPGWNVLWREKQEAPLSPPLLGELPPSMGPWLVVSDDAESIVKDIYQSVLMLHEQPAANIHFLLCCRDTDWNAVNGDNYTWDRVGAKCVKLPLEGLTLEDAEKIVERWHDYDRDGMRDLYGLSVKSAAAKLHEMAVNEAARKDHDGSFLGAMIRTRFSKSIEEHVQELLNRLNRPTPIRNSNGGYLTLLYAYAHIAVLHKMNFLVLTEKILAGALKCSQADLYEHVIGPLGLEAAISTAPLGETVATIKGEVILTRHRAIAEVTVKLFKQFHYRLEDIANDLLQSAIKTLQNRDLSPWRTLPSQFAKEREYRTAIKLGETWVKKEPQNVLHVNYLARFYRADGQFANAAQVFQDAFPKLPKKLKDKLYYHEWATAASDAKNVYTSIWLNGVAIADGGPPNPERNDKYTEADLAKICLNGLSIVFGRVFHDTTKPVYGEAWVAATLLGLKLEGSDLTEGTNRKLKQSLDEIKKWKLGGIASLEPLRALEMLKKGITEAWLLREEQLPIKEGDKLLFTDLRALFFAEGEK